VGTSCRLSILVLFCTFVADNAKVGLVETRLAIIPGAGKKKFASKF